MIVGTAGHIDHGKTTLVHALTGIDTDRLPEEKRRGISIELGYAFLDAPGGGRIAFVDVPGHERLLHTMLAGATGIDHALLLVAADDGVMPQTVEHLAVLSLLGIDRATLVITKADRADAARLESVRSQIAALVAPTALAAAPVFTVCAATGEGVDRLRAHLRSQAAGRPADGEGTAFRLADFDGTAFRLAVDRVFTLAGAGTVVTGTVHGGQVRPDDEVAIAPGGRRVRVRSVHAQNAPAALAVAGQRCALGLAGIAKEAVQRGDWVCDPRVALSTSRLDAELDLWGGEARALQSGTTVHVHLGAADVLGSVALLEEDALAPGRSGLAQIVLRAPLAAWHGDRGVLRDATARRTLAGLRVLDPFAPARWRRAPTRLSWLHAAQRSGAAERMAALLEAAPEGLDLAGWARAEGRVDAAALALPAEAVRLADTHAPVAMAPAAWEALRGAAVEALRRFHAAQPDEPGTDLRRLQRLAAPRVAEAAWSRAVESLLAEGKVARQGAWLHLPEHAARLGDAHERVAECLLPPLAEGGFDPPWVRTLARDTATPEATVRAVLAGLARRGRVYAVVKDLYYPADTVRRLAALARQCAAAEGGLHAASFRDATGLGRKRAIQLLEFFDRVGLTRRVRDRHVLRTGTGLFEAP